MTPYFQQDGVTLYHGDCREILAGLPDESVSAVVTDPPYGLAFMGKRWDYDVPGVEVWAECLRVLKPGGHLLAFAGTRTQHRMAVRIEDAGFEIRDMIAWVYGSGFPKSLDVSKAIDKANGRRFEDRYALGQHIRHRREACGLSRSEVNAWLGSSTKCEHYESRSDGFARVPTLADWRILKERLGLSDEWSELVQRVEAEREVVGVQKNAMSGWDMDGGTKFGDRNITAPATPEAKQWQGWGTALKPSHETITWATKPVANLPELHSIRWSLLRKEAQLWLMLFVSAAENSSPLSRSEFAVACGFAQWSADDARSTLAGLCGQMDTSQCVSVINTTLNTVSSWRSILDDVCEAMNTSTIATKLSTITDWTTWSFCLSQITLADIIQEHSPQSGASSSASSAVRAFQGWIAFCKSILGHFATENAIGKVAQNYQAAGVSPNMEPCIMARKPLSGTVAENVLQHGTGALNVDGCRVACFGESLRGGAKDGSSANKVHEGWDRPWKNDPEKRREAKIRSEANQDRAELLGRWPANLIHDGSEEVTGLFPDAGGGYGVRGGRAGATVGEFGMGATMETVGFGDTGSAARFFYTAKADKADRGPGNNHPTVKPLDLMRYLVRLVCPIGGVVLDPFSGSGTTLAAAQAEGCLAIGVEREAAYCEIIKGRFHQRRLF